MDIGLEVLKLGLSLGVGFLGGLLGDRFKRFAFSLDRERDRLEELVDAAAFRATQMEMHGTPCPNETLADLANKRQRLGINLRRLLGSCDNYAPVSNALALFASGLSKLDPAQGDEPAGLSEELRERGEGLRRAIEDAAQTRFTWKLSRPRRT